MPPRRKKNVQYVYVDSPEVQRLAQGFARKNYHAAGYKSALVEANSVQARALAAPPGVRSAKSAFMIGEPARLGGSFIIPASAKDVICKLKLANRAELDRAFKSGIIAPDPDMPGLVRSIIKGEPVMKTYHYAPDHTGPATRAPRATASSASALEEYTKGLNNLSSLVEGLERDVERSASAHYSPPFGGITTKELDSPLRSLSKKWV